MQGLARIGDDARLHQFDQTRRQHLGVDAQIAMIVQGRAHGVRQGADAHLQRRPVLDQPRDQGADGQILRLLRRLARLQQGRGMFDQGRDLRNVDAAIAEHARHVRIDLQNHPLRALRHGQGVVGIGPETEIALGVHRRDSRQQGVDADLLRQHPRRLLKAGRHEPDGAAAFLDRARLQLPFDGAVEQAVRADAVGQFIAHHRLARDGGGQQVVEVDVADLPRLGPVGQGLQQGRRLADAQGHSHLDARRYQGGRRLGRRQPFGVESGEIGHGQLLKRPSLSDSLAPSRR